LNVSLFLSLFLVVGCFAPSLPPADIAAPGWTVREVPALWRPSADAEELAGEILWAKQATTGELFVQFSKGGLPFLTARRSAAGWTLASPMRKGTFGARSHPPKRFPWFQLNEMPPVSTGNPWRLEAASEGRWILIHPRTGERLEGVMPAP
jgi:hypothetical protein